MFSFLHKPKTINLNIRFDKDSQHDAILITLNKIFMTLKELAEKLGLVSEQFAKGIEEVKTAIANSGNTTPEIDAAVEKLSTAAQTLDDIVPDVPTT